MLSYKRVFPWKHTLLVVIHAESPEQALRNAKIAFDAGANGIFLINHRITRIELFECYEAVRSAFPGKWIGLNWLDLSSVSALSMMQPSMNGLWLDNIGAGESREKNWQAQAFAKDRERREKALRTSFLVFGGVAFKYQPKVASLQNATRSAMPFADVITTSGEGTGIAADLKKIKTMKKVLGDHPFAIASGITPENVHEYMPFADCFIVATGISRSESELDPARAEKLATALSS